MTKAEMLDALLTSQNGVIQTKDLPGMGVSRTYFGEYTRKRGLERVAKGLYLASDAMEDPYFMTQARWPKAILSHDVALYLYGLAEREPMPLTVTVRTGYNPAGMTAAGIKVYRIKQELYDLGKTQVETPYGHMVTAYDPERSLCDLFRSRSQMDAQDLHGPMKEYLRRKEKNIPLLLRYAKALRVERIVKPYLEAVLA